MPSYAAALEVLEGTGRSFPCTCSRAEVRAAASAPHGPGDDGPRYPGHCREGARARARSPSIRFRTEPGDRLEVVDLLAGPLAQDVAAEVGDFVIRRADGVPAYQLAVVVDDLAMGITHVLRGDDLLGSTPRQLLLWQLLGGSAPPPAYAHVPLVVGPDGVRLSKRHGAVGIGELRQAGVSAGRITGALAAQLGLGAPGTHLHPRELLPGFALEKLPRQPTTFDPAVLLPGAGLAS
jgi:glutamyl-tRNA synthetase